MKIILLVLAILLLGNDYPIADSSYFVPPAILEEKPVPKIVTQICNVSAYSASVRECEKADGITASGTKATEGRTIAAGHLPFGTIVRINGQEYIVEDRFGGGYHDRIDIYHENEQDAWDFGRQEIEVEIITKVENAENSN